jgi:hypothetical protein
MNVPDKILIREITVTGVFLNWINVKDILSFYASKKRK